VRHIRSLQYKVVVVGDPQRVKPGAAIAAASPSRCGPGGGGHG
jgi:hypothetical protein